MFIVTLTYNIQCQRQFFDIDNITCRDQRENVQITDKILYFTTLLLGSGVIDNSLKLFSLEDNVFQDRWRLDQIVL